MYLMDQFLLNRSLVKSLSFFESESPSVVSDTLRPHGLYRLWNSPGQNPGVGSLSLLQGIFPTQGSNPGLLHCRRVLYCLSQQGSPQPSVQLIQLSLPVAQNQGGKEIATCLSTFFHILYNERVQLL